MAARYPGRCRRIRAGVVRWRDGDARPRRLGGPWGAVPGDGRAGDAGRRCRRRRRRRRRGGEPDRRLPHDRRPAVGQGPPRVLALGVGFAGWLACEAWRDRDLSGIERVAYVSSAAVYLGSWARRVDRAGDRVGGGRSERTEATALGARWPGAVAVGRWSGVLGIGRVFFLRGLTGFVDGGPVARPRGRRATERSRVRECARGASSAQSAGSAPGSRPFRPREAKGLDGALHGWPVRLRAGSCGRAPAPAYGFFASLGPLRPHT